MENKGTGRRPNTERPLSVAGFCGEITVERHICTLQAHAGVDSREKFNLLILDPGFDGHGRVHDR
jgi:hypothetical protein